MGSLPKFALAFREGFGRVPAGLISGPQSGFGFHRLLSCLRFCVLGETSVFDVLLLREFKTSVFRHWPQVAKHFLPCTTDGKHNSKQPWACPGEWGGAQHKALIQIFHGFLPSSLFVRLSERTPNCSSPLSVNFRLVRRLIRWLPWRNIA